MCGMDRFGLVGVGDSRTHLGLVVVPVAHELELLEQAGLLVVAAVERRDGPLDRRDVIATRTEPARG